MQEFNDTIIVDILIFMGEQNILNRDLIYPLITQTQQSKGEALITFQLFCQRKGNYHLALTAGLNTLPNSLRNFKPVSHRLCGVILNVGYVQGRMLQSQG